MGGFQEHLRLKEQFRKLAEEDRKKRQKTQMTLGELIAHLKQLYPKDKVADLQKPHSYRGYYADLAFEYDGESTISSSELLKRCYDALGQTMAGYKGGDFIMHRNTPLWIARYGKTGTRLMKMRPDGTIVTEEEEEEH